MIDHPPRGLHEPERPQPCPRRAFRRSPRFSIVTLRSSRARASARRSRGRSWARPWVIRSTRLRAIRWRWLLVGLAQFLPFVLCVLPAGQVADRFDRRMVLVCAYAVEAGCAAALLWFTLSGMKASWPVFVAMTVFGAGRAFWMPTGQAMTPNLVPREAFPGAVAVNSTLFTTGVIVGPALSGVLLLRGPQVAYGTVVALLLVMICLMLTIKPVRSSSTPQPFRFGNLLEGPAIRVPPAHRARRDLARSVRGAVRWRHGDDADLRERRSACRAGGLRHVARRAGRRCGAGRGDAGVLADPAQCRALDVLQVLGCLAARRSCSRSRKSSCCRSRRCSCSARGTWSACSCVSCSCSSKRRIRFAAA